MPDIMKHRKFLYSLLTGVMVLTTSVPTVVFAETTVNEKEETVKSGLSILDADANDTIQVKLDETKNLANLKINYIDEDGFATLVPASNLTFAMKQDGAAYASLSSSNVFSWSEKAKNGATATIKVTYSKDGVTASTTLTIKAVSKTSDSSNTNNEYDQEEVATPQKLFLEESDDKTYILDNEEKFNLNQLNFYMIDNYGIETKIKTSKIKFKLSKDSYEFARIEDNKYFYFTERATIDKTVSVQASYEAVYEGADGEELTKEITTIISFKNYGSDKNMSLTNENQEEYTVREGEVFNINNATFKLLKGDGSSKIITGKQLTEVSIEGETKIARLDLNGNLVFFDTANVGQSVTLKGVYKEGYVSCDVKFKVTLVGGANGPSAEKPIRMRILDFDTYEIAYGERLDLNKFEFEIERFDGTTKIVSGADMNKINLESTVEIIKSDSVIYPDREFLFYKTAELGATATIKFTYVEKNQTVDTTIQVKLVSPFESTATKKPIRIQALGTGEKVKQGQVFDTSDLKFKVTYENGIQKEITAKQLDTRKIFIPQGYANVIEKDNLRNVKFKTLVPIGTTAEITFEYSDNGGVVQTRVPITLVKNTESVVEDITSEKDTYYVSTGQSFDLKNVKLFINYNAADGQYVTIPNADYSVLYKDKDKATINRTNHTLKFNQNTKVGDKVTLEFHYSYKGGSVVTPITFINGSKGVVEGTSFLDTAGHWAESSILQLASKYMVVGHSNGMYYPNKEITRGEVAGFIVKYLGLDTTNVSNTPLKDISNSPYNNAIKAVYNTGLIKGYVDNTFKPDAKITREELATILLRVYSYSGKTISQEQTGKFSDETKIASWALDSVMKAKSTGLIGGKENNTFAPKDFTTRAEMAALIVRMMNK